MTDFSKINIRDMGTNRIQKVTVVRNDDYRIVVIGEELLQPHDGFIVQIVGRLIHNQHIGRTK